MHGIEKSLDVYLAFKAVLVGIHLNETSGKPLAVQGVRNDDVSLVEVQFGGDSLKISTEKNLPVVENDDGIYYVLKVPHLVS